MAKSASELLRNTHQNIKNHPRKIPFSPKLSIYLLTIFTTLFILYQSFRIPSWNFTPQPRYPPSTDSYNEKLKNSVTFLPLKDLRFSNEPLKDHTWFMSSIYDTQENGEAQFQEYPSKASQNRILCLKGKDTHDGSWNSYALAWNESLPENSTFIKGLTFVSYNHYNYDNIWHGLSAVVPFVSWHIKNGCSASPDRWVLYHWGELRVKMGTWLSFVMEASFEGALKIEKFDGISENIAACFEKAVVMRHNEGGMSRDKRLEVYDLMRCKSRMYCNVSLEGRISDVNEKGIPIIGMTMFMRSGPRSFQNDSLVIKIFDNACRKVEGCHLKVAYANNLTFCQQVKLMSSTDILISPHGAQLTNMFLMDRNSSVMEFFPKGWLKLAGVGQYVYHWIASWSGMNHHGAWRDPGVGISCPFPGDDRRCMSVYKSATIGYNESYFSQWAGDVLNHVKLRKTKEMLEKSRVYTFSNSCGCKKNY